jgi:Ca2+-binding RTX toxin-like protein
MAGIARVAAAAAAVLLSIGAPGAHAATAGIAEGDTGALVYAADRGEANRLTVSSEGDRIAFFDPGAGSLTPGDGCRAAGANRVTCEDSVFTVARLEDGDDTATTAGGAPTRGDFVSIEGAQGSDDLTAGEWHGDLIGGVGPDTLTGGPFTETLDGTDTYASRGFRHLPLRDAAPDRITCAPASAVTWAEADSSDAVNSPDCAAVAFFGGAPFVAVRGTNRADALAGTAGPTRIFGLGGDDYIEVGSGDRAYGGSGDDRLDADPRDKRPTRLSGESGDDLLLGSAGGDRISGGAGRDRISAEGGRDRIYTRDNERDRVRCGPGPDRVVADPRDSVAKDCERVGRKPPHVSAAAAARCAGTALGSRIVARQGGVVVYKRRGGTFACASAAGPARRLTDRGGGIFHVTIAGQRVAYTTQGTGFGDENTVLYVWDLKAGAPLQVIDGAAISALVLKPNGSVAWVDVAPVSGDGRHEVRESSLVAKQGSLLLDRGTEVGATSLTLATDGDTVSWAAGGTSRSAPLE